MFSILKFHSVASATPHRCEMIATVESRSEVISILKDEYELYANEYFDDDERLIYQMVRDDKEPCAMDMNPLTWAVVDDNDLTRPIYMRILRIQ